MHRPETSAQNTETRAPLNPWQSGGKEIQFHVNNNVKVCKMLSYVLGSEARPATNLKHQHPLEPFSLILQH